MTSDRIKNFFSNFHAALFLLCFIPVLVSGCKGISSEGDAGSDLEGDPDSSSDFQEETGTDVEPEQEEDVDVGDMDTGDTETEDSLDMLPEIDDAADADVEEIATSGGFLMLTYNVAGLPEGISSSHPAVNIPQISPLLNGYDLVVVQEDFWYHNELIADALHPYQSEPMIEEPTLLNMGDGLNRFSDFPFGELFRVTWEECNGYITDDNDCLTTKGFSMAAVELAPGAVVHVYNLHMDAGNQDGDINARDAQTRQLAGTIASSSAGAALIVAGDTNLKHDRPQDMEILDWFLAETGLLDSCRELSCGDDRIDRIMFRNSDSVLIEPLSWYLPDEFIDGGGEPLSDHEPVAVLFSWERVE